MYKFLAMTLVSTVAFTGMGCNKSPETTDPGNNSAVLEGPSTRTTIKKGETKNLDVTVKPSKGYSHKMALKTDVSKDSKVEAKLDKSSVDVSGNNITVPLLITVPKDATPGEYDVTVTGTPDSGPTIKVNVGIKVE